MCESPIVPFLGPIESNIVSPKVGSKIVVLPLIQASHDVTLAVTLAGALLAAAQPEHAQPLPHATWPLLERRDLGVGPPCGVGAVLPLPGGGPAAVLYSKPGAATAAVVGPVPGGLDAEEAVPAHGVPAHGLGVWAGRGVEVAAVGDGTYCGHFGVCLGRLLLMEEAEPVTSLLRVYWLSK